MLPLLFGLTTFVSTTLGGLFAIRNWDRLHLILGFTAGVLLGVVAFDLMPEVFRITNATKTDPTVPMIALVIGFLGFHIIEKLTIIHHRHEHDYEPHHEVQQKYPEVGVMSALALSAHSFLDGVGIGLAFQVSTGVGLAVALAVIAHDFSDGLNTVTLMLVNGNPPGRSLWLLLLDATTPVVGVASTFLVRLNEPELLLYLGVFTGFLLYIGAADILPEAHAKHPSVLTLCLTVAGTLFIFAVTRVNFG